MAGDGIAQRDSRGRIVKREGPTPNAGRPSLAAAEKLRAAIASLAEDEEVMAEWRESMAKKLRKGNTFATAFLRDSLIGKPAVVVHSDTSDALADFMAAWQAQAGTDRDESES